MTFYNNPKRDYVLNPRGKALYDDSNRFGTKMLEKMGWSKGKGLGANLDGQLEFIRVCHKSDQKGVGFQDRDDHWTSHESHFNSLLKSFHSAENSDEDTQDVVVQGFRNGNEAERNEDVDKKEVLFSGVSLEEQSKKSRARVHYKKFTRGKDLSRYSEKDLANIFGKKSLNSVPVIDSAENTNTNVSMEEKIPNFGITTIDTGTTINDYFRNKMKKAAEKSTLSETSAIRDVPVTQDETVDLTIKKEKKKKKKVKTDSIECDKSNQETNAKDDILETSRRSDESEKHSQEQLTENSVKRKHDCDPPKRSKKKKTKEDDLVVVEEASEKSTQCELSSSSRHLTKNTRKQSSEPSSDIQTPETSVDCVTEVDEKCSNKQQRKQDNVDPVPTKRKKKSKERKREEATEICNEQPSDVKVNLFSYAASIGKQEDSPLLFNNNVYKLNSYRAEIFRYFDLQAFPGSTLVDIPGYGYTKDMTLEIVRAGSDDRLLKNMWSKAEDKYANFNNDKGPKKKRFVKHIKALKKKNVFKV